MQVSADNGKLLKVCSLENENLQLLKQARLKDKAAIKLGAPMRLLLGRACVHMQRAASNVAKHDVMARI